VVEYRYFFWKAFTRFDFTIKCQVLVPVTTREGEACTSDRRPVNGNSYSCLCERSLSCAASCRVWPILASTVKFCLCRSLTGRVYSLRVCVNQILSDTDDATPVFTFRRGMVFGEVRPSVRPSVCLSVVCHVRALCLNRSTDFDAAWQVYTGGVQWHIVSDEVHDPQGNERFARVPTGHGKLEKVREFEWSRKGQGKIFFFGKVREKSGKMKNLFHQMSDFQAKMHQIWFPLGLRPRPIWGSLQHSQTP